MRVPIQATQISNKCTPRDILRRGDENGNQRLKFITPLHYNCRSIQLKIDIWSTPYSNPFSRVENAFQECWKYLTSETALSTTQQLKVLSWGEHFDVQNSQNSLDKWLVLTDGPILKTSEHDKRRSALTLWTTPFIVWCLSLSNLTCVLYIM